MYRIALFVWLLLAGAMIANGALREFLYQPMLGYDGGHALSSIFAIVIVFSVAYLFVRAIPSAPHRQWVRTGGLWFALTLGFEVAFGRLVGRSWGELLEAYNLFAGRLWVLVLLSTLVAPIYWSRRLYRRARADLWFRP